MESTRSASASTSTRGYRRQPNERASRWLVRRPLAGRGGNRRSIPKYGEQTRRSDFYVESRSTMMAASTAGSIIPIARRDDLMSETSTPASARPGPRVRRCLRGDRRDRCVAGTTQLCITEDGRTPLIGAWSTVTNWTDQGSPYLWWTGARQLRGRPPGGRGLGGDRPPDRWRPGGGGHRPVRAGPTGLQRLSAADLRKGRRLAGGGDDRIRSDRGGDRPTPRRDSSSSSSAARVSPR